MCVSLTDKLLHLRKFLYSSKNLDFAYFFMGDGKRTDTMMEMRNGINLNQVSLPSPPTMFP